MTQHSKPRNVETATQLRRIAGVLLTTILEVIDGRRPFKQIQTITTGAANGLVYDLVQQRTGTATSTARVRAVHIQLNTPPTTAEFFGTFTRGGPQPRNRRNHRRSTARNLASHRPHHRITTPTRRRRTT